MCVDLTSRDDRLAYHCIAQDNDLRSSDDHTSSSSYSTYGDNSVDVFTDTHPNAGRGILTFGNFPTVDDTSADFGEDTSSTISAAPVSQSPNTLSPGGLEPTFTYGSYPCLSVSTFDTHTWSQSHQMPSPPRSRHIEDPPPIPRTSVVCSLMVVAFNPQTHVCVFLQIPPFHHMRPLSHHPATHLPEDKP